jgi:hypothetical protein
MNGHAPVNNFKGVVSSPLSQRSQSRHCPLSKVFRGIFAAMIGSVMNSCFLFAQLVSQSARDQRCAPTSKQIAARPRDEMQC